MNWRFRNPLVVAAIGVGATLVLALLVVMTLLIARDAKAVADNAALIGALIALGGVFTTQMVNTALEDRRAGAAALQAYLERMGNLLGKNGVSNADERALARAHTLAVLEGLDPKRKGIVVQFLCESKLIPRGVRDEQGKIVKEKVVDLSGANLRDADLFGLNLGEVGLDGAFLERANLREANLPDADLGGTRLYGADLTGANLSGASLWNAQLQSRPDLRLEAAKLSGANLSGANLSGADLSGVDLSEANGVPEEQLEE